MELNQTNSEEAGLTGNIDLGKVLRILVKSIPWILLIILITNAAAFVYLRYTKPIYESSSILKLEIESEASILGFSSSETNNIQSLSGEIELLKSKLFFNRVADVIGYDVSYHFYGRYLNDERYHNSPFKVSYDKSSESLCNRPIDIEILDSQKFNIEFNKGGNITITEHTFGKAFILNGVQLLITKTNFFSTENGRGKYYFTINSKESIVNYLRNNVSVIPENFNAKTIKISLKDFNKYKASEFVNAIDTLYLSYIKETKNLAISQKIEFLDNQIEQTNERLEQFESYFEKFTIKNRTISLQEDMGKAIEYLETLDSQRYNYQIKITNINSIEKRLSSNNLDIITPFVAIELPGIIQTVITEYVSLIAERKLLLKSYKEGTLVINQLDYKIKDLRDQSKELISEYKSILEETLQIVDAQKARINGNFSQLPSMGTEYNKNQRIYSLHENIFLSLRQSKTELEIARAGTVNKSVILSSASTPVNPIHPKKLIIYAAGVISGLVFSLMFVAIKFLLHNKITTIKEIEQLIKAPLLGSIPLYKKGKADVSKLVIDRNPKSAISESFRSIRTNMDFLNAENGNQIISVTSTISGEGKTFIGVNLAGIISLSGKKTCIIDLDMRKPKINQAFDDNFPDEKGVSTILSGKFNLEDCIRTTRIDTLDYLPAGPTPPNPSELLLSYKFKSIINLLKEKYDVIILDTPPVGLVSDGIIVMQISDLQIYVVRSEYSKRSYTNKLNDLVSMNKFNNMAVVFNSVGKNADSTGYGYGYGYGYYEEDSASDK